MNIASSLYSVNNDPGWSQHNALLSGRGDDARLVVICKDRLARDNATPSYVPCRGLVEVAVRQAIRPHADRPRQQKEGLDLDELLALRNGAILDAARAIMRIAITGRWPDTDGILGGL